MPVDDSQVQVLLKRNRQVHIVGKLVRPLCDLLHFENVEHHFGRPAAPLPNIVLQLQVRQSDLEHDLFSQLTVHGDPRRTRLRHDLLLTELFELEPPRVHVEQDELTFEPVLDLAVATALDRAGGRLCTLLELEDERARLLRVVVTLQPQLVRLDTLKLLTVPLDVVECVLVGLEEERRLRVVGLGVASFLRQAELRTSTLLRRQLLEVHALLTLTQAPCLVVSFEKAVLGFLDRLLIVIVGSNAESHLESAFGRELVIHVEVGLALAHHDRWLAKVQQSEQLNRGVEDDDGHCEDGDAAARQRLPILSSIGQVEHEGLAKSIDTAQFAGEFIQAAPAKDVCRLIFHRNFI